MADLLPPAHHVAHAAGVPDFPSAAVPAIPHLDATKNLVMDAAVACPTIVPQIIKHITGVPLMYSLLAVLIAATVFGITGYFVGKRGIAKTQQDLSNALKQIQALPQTVQNVPATVAKDVHLPKV
jgi:hypothetical protein